MAEASGICGRGADILLDAAGDYVQFGEDHAAALYAAADLGPGVAPAWMPKLRTN